MDKKEITIKELARALDIQSLEHSIQLENIKIEKQVNAFKVLEEHFTLENQDELNTKIFKRLYELYAQLKYLKENSNTTKKDLEINKK